VCRLWASVYKGGRGTRVGCGESVGRVGWLIGRLIDWAGSSLLEGKKNMPSRPIIRPCTKHTRVYNIYISIPETTNLSRGVESTARTPAASKLPLRCREETTACLFVCLCVCVCVLERMCVFWFVDLGGWVEWVRRSTDHWLAPSVDPSINRCSIGRIHLWSSNRSINWS
jgi:hypothetical protein